MNKTKYIFISCFILLTLHAFSKNKQDVHPENKIDRFIAEANEHTQHNFDLTLKYYNDVIHQAQKEKDIEKYSIVNAALGQLFHQQIKYDSAAKYLEIALQSSVPEKDYKTTVDIIQRLAVVNLDLGEYIKVSQLRQRKLELNIANQNKSGTAKTYKEFGDLYYFMGEYHQSLQNYLKAMELFTELEDEYEYNKTRYHCALMYFSTGDYDKSEELLQKSLIFFKKHESESTEDLPSYTATIYKRMALIDIAEENYQRGLLYCDSAFAILVHGPSIGWVYAHRGEIYTKMNNYEKALENFELSKKYVPECNHCYWPIYTNISEFFLHFNMLDSAIYYGNKTLERSVTYRYDIRILYTYKVLAEAYRKKGDNENALLFYQSYIDKYNSALDKRKLAMLKKAENEAMNKQIANLQNVNKMQASLVNRQKIFIVISIVFALLLLVIIYIIVLNQKQHRRLLNSEREIAVIKSKIEGQEEERTRIARELHDGIAADLAGVRINLDNLDINPDEPKPVKKIISRITEIGNEVRAISHNLASPTFANLNFEEVTRSFIHQISNNNKLEISFSVYPNVVWKQIDQKIQNELYRVLQEIVNNTIKHSDATTLEIQLIHHQDSLNLTFEDNGKGFIENKEKGMGIKNVSDRIQMLNGEIDINSSPESGTSISIEIPVLIPKPKFSLS